MTLGLLGYIENASPVLREGSCFALLIWRRQNTYFVKKKSRIDGTARRLISAHDRARDYTRRRLHRQLSPMQRPWSCQHLPLGL